MKGPRPNVVTCPHCKTRVHPLGWDGHERTCPVLLDREVERVMRHSDLDLELQQLLEQHRPH